MFEKGNERTGSSSMNKTGKCPNGFMAYKLKVCKTFPRITKPNEILGI
jgi:hypothetical protein